jgi:STE24 endopeptidase
MNDRQQQAKRYERIHNILFVVDILFVLLLLLVLLLSGASKALVGWVGSRTPNPWLQVPLYFGILILGYTLVSAQLGFYSGFYLEHRFGLSNQKFGGWLLDQLKGLALSLVLGLLVLEVLYFLLRATGEWWWLWAGTAFVLFGIVLTHIAPVLILPLFYKVKPIEDEELKQKLVALADRVGVKLLGVFRMEMSEKTKKANAAFAGLGNTKRIILGDTLLNNFSRDEIEVVLAHEMAHYKHRDLWLMMGVGAASTFIGLFIAHVVLMALAGKFGFDGIADLAAFPLFALCMFLFGLITMPSNNAFSRWREYLADRAALELTHNVAAFTSAMNKLAEQNLSDVAPHPAIEFLLHDHPSIARRIAAAERWAAAPSSPVRV